MKKINLKSDELTTNRERSNSGNTSLALGVLFLLISLSTYGVLMFMNNRTKTEIETVQSEIVALKKKLDNKDFVEMYDFQNRLYDIEELIKEKSGQAEVLQRVAAFTLPAVHFLSFDSTVKNGISEIKASIVTQNHYVLSQQIEAYSLMDGVQNVSLLKSQQEGEEVNADLILSLSSKE